MRNFSLGLEFLFEGVDVASDLVRKRSQFGETEAQLFPEGQHECGAEEDLSPVEGLQAFVLEHRGDIEPHFLFFQRLVIEFLGDEVAPVDVTVIFQSRVTYIGGMNESAEAELPGIKDVFTFLFTGSSRSMACWLITSFTSADRDSSAAIRLHFII